VYTTAVKSPSSMVCTTGTMGKYQKNYSIAKKSKMVHSQGRPSYSSSSSAVYLFLFLDRAEGVA
jgi:hypothetical protein